MNLENGWVDAARRVHSPNFDARPDSERPEVLIIHSISLPPGRFGGPEVEQLFTNSLDASADPYFEQIKGIKVSCHFYIRRDGELVQFVSIDDRAWHCGRSVCLGREAVNDFSIGVELEGLDNMEFKPVQYQRLVRLTRCLQAACPEITRERIFGHQHIAPERKTDPGSGFDWYHYMSELKRDRE